MKLIRILVLVAPIITALQQSPGSAGNVVGELKQLKDVLSASNGTNISGKAPVLENKFMALRDHFKDANGTAGAEAKKQDVVAKAEEVIAKAAEQKKEPAAAEAPKHAEKEVVKAMLSQWRHQSLLPLRIQVLPASVLPAQNAQRCAPWASRSQKTRVSFHQRRNQ
jgi:hypothetical protein